MSNLFKYAIAFFVLSFSCAFAQDEQAEETASYPDTIETKAYDPATDPELMQPETSPTSYSSSHELSTELSGMDSLDIAPNEYDTPVPGGTRHNKIETTVFRRQMPLAYNAEGRDPFRALIVDEKKEGEIKTDLLRLDGAILTGVVWSEGQYLAMVKDKDGKNFFLRAGDRIYSGSVVSVSQTEAVFDVSEFGDYSRTTLRVQS
jgi:hypothetical protein